MLTTDSRSCDWWEALESEVKSIRLLKDRCGNEIHPAIDEAAKRAVETDNPFRARQVKIDLANQIFGELEGKLSDLLKFMEGRECCRVRARELQRKLSDLGGMATEQPYQALEYLLLLKRGIQKLYDWQVDQPLSQPEILQRLSSATRNSRFRVRTQKSAPAR